LQRNTRRLESGVIGLSGGPGPRLEPVFQALLFTRGALLTPSDRAILRGRFDIGLLICFDNIGL
jgi:hypothetical protein